MKKILSLLLAVAMMAMIFASCTPAPAEEATSTETDAATDAATTDADPTTMYEGEEIIIYIRMMDSQDKWFRENTIANFQEEYGVTVTVKTFETEADMMNVLQLDAEKGTIGVVKTVGSALNTFVQGDFLMPISEVPSYDAAATEEKYFAKPLEVATDDEGNLWALPRKMESYAMAYSISAVEDAAANWETQRDVIEAAFEAENGVGLPTDYTLEADPNEWDWFDLAVAGMYWGNTEINGVTTPRIAHRTKIYEGTTFEIMCKVFQMNGTPEDMLDPTSAPVVEAMKWEAFSVGNDIYNPTMWEEMWSGGGIWNGFANGSVYLAFMTQLDDFFLHGGSNPDMTGYLADPSDLGVSTMPRGVSMELNDEGQPAITGTKEAYDNSWYWSIPKDAPNPDLSLELINYINNDENHAAEASTFGIMPVTNTVLDNLDSVIQEEWMSTIFATGQAQIDEGVYGVPAATNWTQISTAYQEAWHEICLAGDTSTVEAGLEALKEEITPLLD